MNNKIKVILVAIFVTVLWSSSYIINKAAFQEEIKPITLAALRYFFAALILLLANHKIKQSKNDSKLTRKQIIILGVLGYAVAQGLQYRGQFYLTPIQSSLFLSLANSFAVLIIDLIWLKENLN